MIELNKVHCMDCLDGMKLLNDCSVDCIITDPPYEVNYNNKSKELEKLGKARIKQIERDLTFVDSIFDYDIISSEFFRILKNNSHIYLFCGDKQIVKWVNSMTNAGFKNYQILVWKKTSCTFDLTFGHKFPENKEFILFFHKGWKKLNGYSDERCNFRSCMTFPSSADTKYHSCAKPQSLISKLVKLSSCDGDLILDPFAGSGQVGLVSRNLSRSWLMFEISSVYCQIINNRLIQNHLGSYINNK